MLNNFIYLIRDKKKRKAIFTKQSVDWDAYKTSTHVKISQLVPSLQTSRQQVVFARLVTTSCRQVWSKLLTTCNNLAC